MGEIAEAMLDGTFCQECGAVFDDILNGAEPPGYPRSCRACRPAKSFKKRARAALAKARGKEE